MSQENTVLLVTADAEGDMMQYEIFSSPGVRRWDYCWAIAQLIFCVAEEFNLSLEAVSKDISEAIDIIED